MAAGGARDRASQAAGLETAAKPERSEVLELLAAGAPLEEILADLTIRAEGRFDDLLCSVSLVAGVRSGAPLAGLAEGGRLRLVSAPSLPAAFQDGFDTVAPIRDAGCCGRAITTGRCQVIEDLEQCPEDDAHGRLMSSAGLRACWAQPIVSTSSSVLGVFTAYLRVARSPGVEDLHFLSAVAHLAGVAIDHHRAKEALLSSADLWKVVVENVPYPMALIDLEGQVRCSNRLLEEKLPTQGASFVDALPREHRQGFRLSMAAMARRGQVVDYEPPEDGRGRTERFCCYLIAPVVQNGRAVAGVVSILDVSELRYRERALIEERERIQSALQAVGEGVIIIDREGRVEAMNPTAEVLTGWMQEEAARRPLREVFQLVDEKSRKAVADPVERCRTLGRVSEPAGRGILLSRSGREYAVDESASRIRASSGDDLGLVLVFSDVTESRRLAQQMAHQTTHDALTGLVNRREFVQRLERALANAQNRGGHHAICYLNLDKFKIINDTAGHLAGDELLRQVGALLVGRVRSRDTLARLGGDEFGLLLEHCPPDKGVEVAEALLAALRGFRFSWEGRSFDVSASVGVVPISEDTESTAQLLHRSHMACYTAKDLGRGRVQLYHAGDQELARRHLEILRANELAGALDENRFRLYCQQIFPLSENEKGNEGYEILLRLRDSGGGLLLPGAFLPAAERYGMMPSIDRWVIRTVLTRYAPKLTGEGNVRLSINLSGASLNDEGLLDFVLELFQDVGVVAERICFEINEAAAVDNLARASSFASGMRRLGCRFALDDFGRGLSSFSYLKTLPVDYLKIHGSFIRDMLSEPVDNAMVIAINQVGHSLGMHTIGECAESEAAVERLRELGVDYAQGFALGSPRPLDEVLSAVVG